MTLLFDTNSRDDLLDYARYGAGTALFVAIGMFAYAMFSISNSASVDGLVTSVFEVPQTCHRGKHNDGPAYPCPYPAASIKYSTADGRPESFDVALGDILSPLGVSTAVGQKVAVRYNLQNPSKAHIDNVMGNFAGPIALSILFLVLGVPSYLLRTSEERAHIKVLNNSFRDAYRLHAESRSSGSSRVGGRKPVHSAAPFITALFSLLGRFAKADGVISTEEILRIDRFMKIELGLTGADYQAAMEVFKASGKNAFSFQRYAQDCKDIYSNDPAMLHTIYTVLEEVSRADGSVSEAEAELLNAASMTFFGESRGARASQGAEAADEWDRPESRPQEDMYSKLGVQPMATIKEIKSAYRKLVLQFHPDRLVARGLPESLRKSSEGKFREIQSAYEQICADRDMH